MENSTFKSDMKDNVFLTSVSNRFGDRKRRFGNKRRGHSISSRAVVSSFKMYEEKPKKFPSIKRLFTASSSKSLKLLEHPTPDSYSTGQIPTNYITSLKVLRNNLKYIKNKEIIQPPPYKPTRTPREFPTTVLEAKLHKRVQDIFSKPLCPSP